MEASLQQRTPPLLILKPAARVLELAGQLAPKVHHVLNVHLEIIKNTVTLIS